MIEFRTLWDNFPDEDPEPPAKNKSLINMKNSGNQLKTLFLGRT